MRVTGLLIASLLLCPQTAFAEDPQPRRPIHQVVAEVADLAIAAVKDKDEAALRKLAERDDPDPWLVADALCGRQAHDTALAFAKAAPRVRLKTLPAYVESRRGQADQPKLRKIIAQALEMGDREATLKLVPHIEGPLRSLSDIRTATIRGQILYDLEQFHPSALAFERGAAACEKLGWLRMATAAHYQSGVSWWRFSDLEGAIRCWAGALRVNRQLGDRKSIGRSLGNVGLASFRSGDYPGALRYLQEARGIFKDLALAAEEARALTALGTIHQQLGNLDAALRDNQAALKVFRRLKHRSGTADTLTNVGLVLADLGKYEEALRHYQESMEVRGYKQRSDAYADITNAANTQHNMGNAYAKLGDDKKALECYELALGNRVKINLHAGIATSLVTIAGLYTRTEQYELALETWEKARSWAEDSPTRGTLARVHAGLAKMYLRVGRVADALKSARMGAEFVGDLAHGLAEGESAVVRDTHAGVFSAGYVAAAKSKDPASLLWFLEQARAGTLRESLGSREDLVQAVVPAALKAKLRVARRVELRAGKAFQQAAQRGTEAQAEAARGNWERAQTSVSELVQRIERESKHAAAVNRTDTDDLPTIQGYLQEGEVLVYYALPLDYDALALVVERDSARIVGLPPSEEVTEAAAALSRLAKRPGARGFADKHERPVDLAATLATLGKSLVAPLGLGDQAKRILLSPMGELGYVPFTMLFDEELAYVPSGTTYGLQLREKAKRGKRVLALGDPVYGDGEADPSAERAANLSDLKRLPATRDEVKAIGDVRLLGAQASESGLRKQIAEQTRWRAVHLACHGYVDSERPRLSALLLTPDDESDGLLTALEVFLMQVPADLVVMSACDTGKGKAYKTEGIVGLTRAFMFAGAPRVICSMWKVDDDATRELMVEFYRLWNPKSGKPGLNAALALKQAQAHVRSQQKWAAPYYWAAWCLWGLPH